MTRLASIFVLLTPLVAAGVRAQSVTAPDPGVASNTMSNDAAPAGNTWRLMMSTETVHYTYNPDHRHVYMLGAERQSPGGLVLGGTWFRNSFGQPSAYVYAGRRFSDVLSYEPLFAQLTAGVLYGYKPPFENKVPFNHNGWSPGVVASLGWQFTPLLSAQVNFLGNSALMLQFSADFH